MALDAVFLSALVAELKERLLGAVIDKVQQPARDTVLFTLRGFGPQRLVINVGTGSARVCLSALPADNPPQPPMFCMLLRKYLVGARICDVVQPGGDRIVELRLQCRDALGTVSDKRLIAELMGRNSNLLLCEDDGHIIDCLRRVAGGEDVKRPVLPGLIYHYPDAREGMDILTADAESIARAVNAAPEDIGCTQWLQRTFRGISPLICRELSYRALGETDGVISGAAQKLRLCAAITDFAHEQRSCPRPYLIRTASGGAKDFASTQISQYGGLYECAEYDDFSAMLDEFYSRRDTQSRMQSAAHDLRRSVKTARDRVRRRLVQQRKEYEQTENRDTLRENGDIITANLWNMHKGMRTLRAQDFYSDDPQAMREIPLDPLKTPQQNAAKYYKDYNRAKTARRILTEQLEKGEGELYYLESVLDELERAETLSELNAIRHELEESGWVKKPTGKKQRRPEKSGPLRYVSPEGFEIFVGRSNIENDRLTLKTARKDDLWLHVKDMHGSHVIISAMGGTPNAETVSMAASLAVWFSQARDAGKTAVDVTHAGNVKKPSGALPGRVIYTDYHTVYAAGDEKLAKSAK